MMPSYPYKDHIIIQIRRPRSLFNWKPIPKKRNLYIETGPWCFFEANLEGEWRTDPYHHGNAEHGSWTRIENPAAIFVCLITDSYPMAGLRFLTCRSNTVNENVSPITSSLRDAIKEGDVKKVRRVLQEPDVNLEELEQTGMTPLGLAADLGHLEIVKLLIKVGVYADVAWWSFLMGLLHRYPIPAGTWRNDVIITSQWRRDVVLA